MKRNIKIFAVVAALALPVPVLAENHPGQFEHGDDANETSLFEEVSGIKKKTDAFHLYMNTQTNATLNWSGEDGSDFDGGKFAFKQLRLEMKGNVKDWLSYRFRMRLNKGQSEDGYFDNVLKSIDIMEVGFKYKKVNFVVGKQCAAYGGIEFDLNPIEVYQYCDMIDYMDNFMTGVRAEWQINPKHQMQFQILDAVALNPGQMYGENVKNSKLPLVYTVNWNGTFGQDIYKTRWSASVMNETKNRYMYYFALGNQFKLTDKWGAWIDFMYSREGIDRKGIITNVLTGYTDKFRHNAFNTEYLTLLLHTNYFITPKWNVFAKVAWERNGVYKNTLDIRKGNYGTDWLYVGGVEFYPLKDKGLHFFLTYIGQNITHSEMARKYYGAAKDYFTNALTAGFIWQIPLF